MRSEEADELHKIAENHGKRIEGLEDDVRSLRKWRHDHSNTTNAIGLKVDDLKLEMESQDLILEEQRTMATSTNTLVKEIDSAIRGKLDGTPGMIGQLRTLTEKERRRDKWASILMTAVLGQLVIGGGWLVLWVIRH